MVWLKIEPPLAIFTSVTPSKAPSKLHGVALEKVSNGGSGYLISSIFSHIGFDERNIYSNSLSTKISAGGSHKPNIMSMLALFYLTQKCLRSNGAKTLMSGSNMNSGFYNQD